MSYSRDEAYSPATAVDIPTRRSLDDYAVTRAAFIPHASGQPWDALSWPMWERAEECLVQFEKRLASPATAPTPDLGLLVATDHAWGPIAEVAITHDDRDGSPVLELRFRDHRINFLHRPRLFDPACGLLVMLLALPGGSIEFNHDGGDRTHLYHGAYKEKTGLRRIFSNTQPGYAERDPIRSATNPHGHISYRMRDRREPRAVKVGDPLEKQPYRGRADAFGTARECFEKRAQGLHTKISGEAYYGMLVRCARIIDLLYGPVSTDSLAAPRAS